MPPFSTPVSSSWNSTQYSASSDDLNGSDPDAFGPSTYPAFLNFDQSANIAQFSSMMSDPAKTPRMRDEAVNQAAQMLAAQAANAAAAQPVASAEQPQAAAAPQTAAAPQEETPPVAAAFGDVANLARDVVRTVAMPIVQLGNLVK